MFTKYVIWWRAPWWTLERPIFGSNSKRYWLVEPKLSLEQAWVNYGHMQPVKVFNPARGTLSNINPSYFFPPAILAFFSTRWRTVGTLTLGVTYYSVCTLVWPSPSVKMSGPKEREVDTECRLFNKEGTTKYFFHWTPINFCMPDMSRDCSRFYRI